MAVHGRAHPAPAVISRGSLADAPVLTTPAPLVIGAPAATPGWGTPNAGMVISAPQAPAAPALATPPPVVVAAQTPATPPRQALTSRSSLADAPVLVTRAPLVAGPAATPGYGTPGPPAVSSAPFIPAAAPTQATPGPVIAWTQPPAVPPGPAITSRNSLADAPVLTTPAPVVVMATALTPWGKPQAAVIGGTPAAPPAVPAATPQPVVVTAAVKLAAAQPPVILRGSLADAPVLVTPRPVVVMTQVRPPPVTTVITGAPFIVPPPLVAFGRSAATGRTLTAATPGAGPAATATPGTGTTATATPGGAP